MGMNPRVERPLMRPRSEVLAELRRRELRHERQEFGGQIQWEAVFFGLLAAIGLAASLVAMVLGGLVATGVTSFGEDATELVDRMMAGGGAIAAAIPAWIAGGQLDPTESISLPSNPVDEGPLNQGAAAIAPVLVAVPLLAALIGGVLGDRFHRAVDRAGFEELEREPAEEAATEEPEEPETEVQAEEEAESAPPTDPTIDADRTAAEKETE